MVTVAPEADVFASVNGFHKWVPWLLFSAFALALIAAFALLYRVLRNAAELTVAHEQLDASNRVLQRRAKELERSNAELEQFASIASHDLQEPLRKVQMFSQRAMEVDGDKLSEKGRDYLRRNTEAASRMQMLIEDLLMFSRVGTQGRPFVETDLNKTVARGGLRPRDHDPGRRRQGGGRRAADRGRRRAADPPAVSEPDLERDQVPAPGRTAGGPDRR